MEKSSLVAIEQPLNVQSVNVLVIEQFLTDNYQFRRNVLNGKVEFAVRFDPSADFRPLTQEALNSIIIRALREGLDRHVCQLGGSAIVQSYSGVSERPAEMGWTKPCGKVVLTSAWHQH